MRRVAFLLGGALCASLCVFETSSARADWLPGPSRAISIADSAAPNAPVSSYAYGPRAQASIGGDLALFSVSHENLTFRLGGSALVAFEDASRHAVLPGESQRTAFALSGAWAISDFMARALGPGKEVELSLALGRDFALAGTDYTLSDRYHPDDVPFGAGGDYVSVDAALKTLLGGRFEQFSRLGFRADLNAFPDLVGAHAASDTVADSLHEGGEYQAFFELGLRFHACPQIEPLARLYFDLIEPHDDSAKTLALVRLLLGAALPGKSFELTPFTAFEAGHGEGIWVNRTELRWSGGVRLDAR
ncbi:MAG TPA: hypothetical protein VGM44_00285 [Polyangiaceae bacterium]|jgi:hypothetical protein